MDELDPELKEEELEDDDMPKSLKEDDDESSDALAEIEDELLPEDKYDDFDPL